MTKGRPSISLSKEELQDQIDLAEQSNTFSNISKLCDFIEDTTWAKTRLNSAGKIQALKKQVIYQRINQWNLTHKTESKKREVKKTKIKLSDFNKPDCSFAEVPEKYQELAKRALTSKVSALKMKCLDCSNYQPKEIRDCLISDCPLYNHRPFKRKENDVKENLTEDVIINELVILE